ncbi:MAG: hypothetical protein LBE09_00425 [Christensenellaceae bacterium]|jgi:hypothetical protein|nr:hypothetical protein [Christensenellaceae bacterium]
MINKPFDYHSINKLLLGKYKAEVIDKLRFRDLLYGVNRTDIGEEVSELTEGLIETDNSIFYLINDVEVLNANCVCVPPEAYPNGKVFTGIQVMLPYILFVIELSNDKGKVINYGKWGSFGDNLFKEMAAVGLI